VRKDYANCGAQASTSTNVGLWLDYAFELRTRVCSEDCDREKSHYRRAAQRVPARDALIQRRRGFNNRLRMPQLFERRDFVLTISRLI
jgi:hypothetical protein